MGNLQAQYEHEDDSDRRDKIRARIGRLMGGSATLWIGGLSESEIEARKASAEATADAMRAAVREGVLPGGGLVVPGMSRASGSEAEWRGRPR